MDLPALTDLLGQFDGVRVLCLGDVMLDRYVYGEVSRISPEAPIPVVGVDHEEVMPGGAANVARNVAALGARVDLIGIVGGGEAAVELNDLLGAQPGISAALIADPGRRTSLKTRYIAAGQQLLRADREDTGAISATLAKQVLAAYRDALQAADVVILSDYGKGVLADAVLRPAIALARDQGKHVVADPKSLDFARYAGVSVLKPNRGEIAAATRLPCDDDAQAVAAATRVIEDCGIDSVLLSRSEQGVSLIIGDQPPLHLPARAREIFDVSGAGDTMIATFAVALGAGAAAADAARLANIAAGVVVTKLGTAAVYQDDLAQALHTEDLRTSDAKVVGLERAREIVAAWRSRGRRIGFTNGVFDLMHPGHVSLLNEASDACDRLIVAINSDASVKRLKGEGRPVQGETARATVLASLAMVDLVVIFADDTPVPLLEALRPDVLVKGGDYSLDQVVGGDLVRGYGGEVRLAQLKQGHSTTKTIERLKG